MLAIALLLNLFLLIAIRFYQYTAKLSFFGFDFWLTILSIALLPTIFGINLFLFGFTEIRFGAHSILSDGTMRTVYIDYYISWIFLFFLMGVGQHLLRLPDRQSSLKQFEKVRYQQKFYLIITVTAIGLLGVDLLMFESWPGISGILNDISGAEESKGAFIEEKIKNSVPVVGYLIRFFPLLAVVLLFERLLSQGKGFLFWLLISFFLIYSLLSLIKAFLLNALLVCVFVYFVNTRRKINIRLVMKLSILTIVSVYIPFALLLGGDSIDLLSSILRRFFVAQIEGAFLIRQIYTEVRLDALLEAAPLLARFGFETFDPAEGVIIELFGGPVPGWVNMNSHFVGQGFVMFGPLIPIIGPIILYLNFAILNLISRTWPLGPHQHLSSAIVMVCAMLVPINNNFGNAVYLKSIIAYLLLFAFCGCLILLSRIKILPNARSSSVKPY